jgi:hypothetical protein
MKYYQLRLCTTFREFYIHTKELYRLTKCTINQPRNYMVLSFFQNKRVFTHLGIIVSFWKFFYLSKKYNKHTVEKFFSFFRSFEIKDGFEFFSWIAILIYVTVFFILFLYLLWRIFSHSICNTCGKSCKSNSTDSKTSFFWHLCCYTCDSLGEFRTDRWLGS